MLSIYLCYVYSLPILIHPYTYITENRYPQRHSTGIQVRHAHEACASEESGLSPLRGILGEAGTCIV